MSEIWSSDQLTINMGSFSDSVSKEERLLSTWLSHAIEFDGNCSGIEHNIFDQYEACENPMEVYGTMGAYSDVFQSRYVEQSPNYACSTAISPSMEIGRTSPKYNYVGSSGYICSSLQDPTAISYYWQEDCMKSCPSDKSGALSVSPSSSSSCEQEGSRLRVQNNSNEGFPVGFDEYPAFHSCSEDLMKNMVSESSNMAELQFSNLPVYNIVMQNISEGEKDDAGNLQKVDAVFKSKSEGDDQICYVNQFPTENEREETNRMPINDAVEDPHPRSKRHCSERLMADRANGNAMPAVERSSLMPASIEPTMSSTVGRACNTDGKPRARRGSATDPQSLYARQRRERINERLKVLQNLIPNGTKVDISTMLEEALHYVKFLQLQIKILSSDDHWMQGPIAFHAVDAACRYSKTMKTGI